MEEVHGRYIYLYIDEHFVLPLPFLFSKFMSSSSLERNSPSLQISTHKKYRKQICGSVPVGVKYALSRTWSRDADAVFDAKGRLLIWEDAMEERKKQEDLEPAVQLAQLSPAGRRATRATFFPLELNFESDSSLIKLLHF